MPVMLHGADDRFVSSVRMGDRASAAMKIAFSVALVFNNLRCIFESAMPGGPQTADHKRRWSAPRLRPYCALFPPQTTSGAPVAACHAWRRSGGLRPGRGNG